MVLFGKKLRLKRLEGEFELVLLLPWRSGSCIKPFRFLFENGPWCGSWSNVWFGSVMKKAEEGIDCCGECCTPNDEDWFRDGIKCSNFAAPVRRKVLLLVAFWLWFWSCWEIWVPICERPKVMWFVGVPYKLVPKGVKPFGSLALSCARASQKALWVMKLSRLQKYKKNQRN